MPDKVNAKTVFIDLCFTMALENGYMATAKNANNAGEFFGAAIGASLLSIPIWSCIGVILANIGLFFYNLIKPEEQNVLTVWHKTSLGLIVGILLKPEYYLLPYFYFKRLAIG